MLQASLQATIAAGPPSDISPQRSYIDPNGMVMTAARNDHDAVKPGAAFNITADARSPDFSAQGQEVTGERSFSSLMLEDNVAGNTKEPNCELDMLQYLSGKCERGSTWGCESPTSMYTSMKCHARFHCNGNVMIVGGHRRKMTYDCPALATTTSTTTTFTTTTSTTTASTTTTRMTTTPSRGPSAGPVTSGTVNYKELVQWCGAKCAEAGYCCNDPDRSSNHMFSCAQGCMMRNEQGLTPEALLSTSNGHCLRYWYSRCYETVSGKQYTFCDGCQDQHDGCPDGVQSATECDFGAQLVHPLEYFEPPDPCDSHRGYPGCTTGCQKWVSDSHSTQWNWLVNNGCCNDGTKSSPGCTEDVAACIVGTDCGDCGNCEDPPTER